MDQDLLSVQEARTICRQAKSTCETLKSFSQEAIDKVVTAMAEAGFHAARVLAERAFQETCFGLISDKVLKNQLATREVLKAIKPLKTVGVINEIENGSIVEIAEPVGVIAGIIPSTNPTSTTLFKSIIALKARNAIVFSPHPAAVNSTIETVKLMQSTISRFGIPREAIGVLTRPTLGATEELMRNRNVSLILATGGTKMVRAAYSSGKPAFGVGPGNVPAFIERSADLEKAVADIIASKTFDNGTVCASEQAIIVDSPVYDKVVELLKERRAHFLSPEEKKALSRELITPEFTTNPGLVGRPATVVARAAGVQVPEDTTLLVAKLDRVGRQEPLSAEKLCPVIALYREEGWQAGCDRAIELLRFGGIGHTLVIHSNNRQIIMEFALKKPAYRILVNTPSTHGAVGLTTNLPPSLTLGCGALGGNMTSDNITPLHLINIKRLAFETKPVNHGTSPKSARSKRLITEEDVRLAMSRGEKIEPGQGTIVTPAARDLLGRQKA